MFDISGDCHIHCDTCHAVCDDDFYSILHEEVKSNLNRLSHDILERSSTDLCPSCYAKRKETSC